MKAALARLVARRLRARASQAGYAAVMVALLLPIVFLGCAAFAVDTARWYVEAERVQRAADAAALAGVVWMPADFATAKTAALAEAKRNGYDDASSTVTVVVAPGDKPSHLQVTINSTVTNNFGSAIGSPSTTVGRSATADYAGGLSMGSPCNEFGSDPDTALSSGNARSGNCSDAGDFWANVGSLKATKVSGDAFQDNVCASGVDGCTSSSGPNTDYDPDGYLYTVNTTAALNNVNLEVFDPALIAVGDHCTSNNLALAKALTSTDVANASTRYKEGDGPYCTGDNDFGSGTGYTNQVSTDFTVRLMGAADDPTRPTTWPEMTPTQCPGAKPYKGYDGDLSKALNKGNSTTYDSYVAANFRRWVPLCTLGSLPKDSKLAIQVKTNGVGNDNGNGHNRFGLRGYSSSSTTGKDSLSIAAFNKMAVYANVQGGSSRFFLTRVPSAAKGQTLAVSLFDIGDISGGTGTLKFIAPSESGITFTNCLMVGKVNTTDADCQIPVDGTFGGKWQNVYIQIPNTYTCYDSLPTGCWVKLNYDLTGTSSAQDTTSWESSIDGDPVRLIK
ncbi:hypothetical protein KRR39_12075 [Nocardioides panacis]|uniref:Putative Flp pilus-assembly TadG-like N-terminal domain-containing protein n=1 Tax=Nocardioides panacis TaxID=2849501 RepID=A0A975XYI8_9ACTN|nr:pilus assembly protein TadG-related protein [Nocardioides panacis]QWZ06353.1 hypothetical protein KRR39_12075 [Nocardioides panacis]